MARLNSNGRASFGLDKLSDEAVGDMIGHQALLRRVSGLASALDRELDSRSEFLGFFMQISRKLRQIAEDTDQAVGAYPYLTTESRRSRLRTILFFLRELEEIIVTSPFYEEGGE